jgi:hypothetical protein
MPRKPNSIKTAPITISTTPPIVEYLEDLVDTGFYGKTPADAAERLVGRSIQSLIRDGTLLKLKKRHHR